MSMSKSKSNHLPVTPPRKPRPGYKRIVTGFKPIPMHVSHVPTAPGESRCPRCWLRNPKPKHPCLKRIANEDPGRDPRPAMIWVPQYSWVKDHG